MKKEFTVGDMISVMSKLDPALPIYDHFFDDDVGSECWFNVEKPKPKKQTLYLRATVVDGKIRGEWTDDKGDGEILQKKKVVMLYPPDKGTIEIG